MALRQIVGKQVNYLYRQIDHRQNQANFWPNHPGLVETFVDCILFKIVHGFKSLLDQEKIGLYRQI